MNPLRSRLYWRLLAWFVVANAVTLLASVGVTERLARAAYARTPDWTVLAQDADRAYIDGGAAALERWVDEQRRAGLEAVLFEGTRNLTVRHPPVPRGVLSRLLAADDDLELRPQRDVVIAVQRVTGSDQVERRLVAARGRHPPPHRLGQMLLVHICTSLLAIGVLGWWLARSIGKPVAAVGAAARRVAGGDLAARVDPAASAGHDEVAELARDFDRMAARIESLVTAERRVLQDVSHELRSPLARLQLLLERAQRGAPEASADHFQRAEREIARLDRLIGDALALSRMESDLPGMQRETLDLAALAQVRAADHGLDAESRSIRLDLTVAPAPVRGQRELLARAIDNLLSNAIKFSADGGRVEVSVAVVDGRATLRVRDHGPGVPAEELASLFQPFFRGSNAERAQGHGLGLAIVERIASGHGGRVSAANADGGGLAVTLELPLAAA